jgi:GNAT superfamily N-acetyltransferase
MLFLWLIAAEPEKQRQGLGSLLMRRINEAADQRGLPCYLEATTEGR